MALFLFACKQNPQQQNPAGAATSALDTTNSKADSNDLLDALQGQWQSEQDATYVLEITGSKMRHLNGGKLTVETDIEVDSQCETMPCVVDSITVVTGWCFVEKGPSDAQCNMVVKCDSVTLQYKSLGAANALLAFKRK
jgi:hypothetical protein